MLLLLGQFNNVWLFSLITFTYYVCCKKFSDILYSQDIEFVEVVYDVGIILMYSFVALICFTSLQFIMYFIIICNIPVVIFIVSYCIGHIIHFIWSNINNDLKDIRYNIRRNMKKVNLSNVAASFLAITMGVIISDSFAVLTMLSGIFRFFIQQQYKHTPLTTPVCNDKVEHELVEWLRHDDNDRQLIKYCCIYHLKYSQRSQTTTNNLLTSYLENDIQPHRDYYSNITWTGFEQNCAEFRRGYLWKTLKQDLSQYFSFRMYWSRLRNDWRIFNNDPESVSFGICFASFFDLSINGLIFYIGISALCKMVVLSVIVIWYTSSADKFEILVWYMVIWMFVLNEL